MGNQQVAGTENIMSSSHQPPILLKGLKYGDSEVLLTGKWT